MICPLNTINMNTMNLKDIVADLEEAVFPTTNFCVILSLNPPCHISTPAFVMVVHQGGIHLGCSALYSWMCTLQSGFPNNVEVGPK